MLLRKSLIVCLGLGSLLLVTPGHTQTPAASSTPAAAAAEIEGGTPHYIHPETPEQRQARLGTQKDPGPNPSPEEVFERNGQRFWIERFEKRTAKYIDRPGWVNPFASVNVSREIYQENEKYLWVWHPIQSDEELMAALPEEQRTTSTEFRTYSKEDVAYFQKLRAEFSILEPPASTTAVRFEESSAGLPKNGSFRNGAAAADINADGFMDLILPPQRGAAGAPAIYLGSATGEWTRWRINWPRGFNYGTVVVADFNKDKHLDLAFAIHLAGVGVYLHDGKGNFTEVTEGLKKDFPTRRVVATDINDDGWMDVVAISEGPVGRADDKAARARGTLRAYLNRNKGQSWEEQNIAGKHEYTGGDFLTALDFNGDKYPDLIGANIYFNATHTLFISKGKGEWESFGSTGLNVPGRSYYYGTTAGKFLKNSRTEDAIQTYTRSWPTNLDSKVVPVPPTTRLSGIDRITWANGSPKRTSIARWEGIRGVRGISDGDFDGDGNLDLVYADERARTVELLLGDGSGSFKRSATIGLPLQPQRLYDLMVADFNGDKRPDVMVMYETDSRTAFEQKTGSVRVYLNRGPAARELSAAK
jgi:hypothetical protein